MCEFVCFDTKFSIVYIKDVIDTILTLGIVCFRPYIIVENGEPSVTSKHIEDLSAGLR